MTSKQMGRKGGKSKSPAKQAAARENGKLGGRPRAYYSDNAPTLPSKGLSGNARQRRKQRRKENVVKK